MSTERTPFVTDDDLLYLVFDGKPEKGRFVNLDDYGRKIRDLYESELARKDAEIEALREQLNTSFHG